jgi:hypothetical protein
MSVWHVYLTLNPPLIHFSLENKILFFSQLKALNYLVKLCAINGAKWMLKAGY